MKLIIGRGNHCHKYEFKPVAHGETVDVPREQEIDAIKNAILRPQVLIARVERN